VLHVRGASGDRTDRRGVRDAASKRQKADQHEAAADLEAPIVKVLVRHPVAREMKRDAEQRCGRPRGGGRTEGGARGGMHGDDHNVLGSSLPPLATEIAR